MTSQDNLWPTLHDLIDAEWSQVVPDESDILSYADEPEVMWPEDQPCSAVEFSSLGLGGLRQAESQRCQSGRDLSTTWSCESSFNYVGVIREIPMRTASDLGSEYASEQTSLQTTDTDFLIVDANHPKQRLQRRRQSRITSITKAALFDFLSHTPYPSSEEVEALSDTHGLSSRQIRNWFSNTRSRYGRSFEIDVHNNHARLYQSRSHSETCLFGRLGAGRDIARLSEDSLEELSGGLLPDETRQLKVFISEPSEWIAAAVIETTAAQVNTTSRLESATVSRLSANDRAPSIRSWAATSSVSSATTWRMNQSVSPKLSLSALCKRASRRGRRRFVTGHKPYARPTTFTRSPSSNPPPASTRPTNLSAHDVHQSYTMVTDPIMTRSYFCTFCEQQFKTPYEWTRHEEALHVHRTTWFCCSPLDTGLAKCPFCIVTNPDASHLMTHDYFACSSKPEEERTFFRRDHFVQHIHNVHLRGSKHPDRELGCFKNSGHGCNALIEQWRYPAATLPLHDPKLHCGFCGVWMKTWEERRQHVSDHFKTSDHHRSSWWPDRLPPIL